MRNRAHSTSYLTYGLQADLLTILYATANCPPMCLYYNIKRQKFQYADKKIQIVKKSRSRHLYGPQLPIVVNFGVVSSPLL